MESCARGASLHWSLAAGRRSFVSGVRAMQRLVRLRIDDRTLVPLLRGLPIGPPVDGATGALSPKRG